MSKAAMQEHFINLIHGDAPVGGAEGEATKHGPVEKAAAGRKKDNRNFRAWRVMEGLSRYELVRCLILSAGVSGIMISRIIGSLNKGIS